MHHSFNKNKSRDEYRIRDQQFQGTAPQQRSTMPGSMPGGSGMQGPTPPMGEMPDRRRVPTPPGMAPVMPPQAPGMRPQPPQGPSMPPQGPGMPSGRPPMGPGMPSGRPPMGPGMPSGRPPQGPGMRPQPPVPPQGPPQGPPPGMENGPSSAPPNFIPLSPNVAGGQTRQSGERFRGSFATNSRDFFNCRSRFTYIWLINGSNFWFFPTFIDRRFVFGFRWSRDRWVYDRIFVNSILFFACF